MNTKQLMRVITADLEWQAGDGVTASTEFYSAEVMGLRYCVIERQWWLSGTGDVNGVCDSDEAAKAACQADFEERMYDCISADLITFLSLNGYID